MESPTNLVSPISSCVDPITWNLLKVFCVSGILGILGAPLGKGEVEEDEEEVEEEEAGSLVPPISSCEVLSTWYLLDIFVVRGSLGHIVGRPLETLQEYESWEEEEEEEEEERGAEEEEEVEEEAEEEEEQQQRKRGKE